MKALVTGGNGFLGMNLVEELVRQGFDVNVYDKETRLLINKKAKFFNGDLSIDNDDEIVTLADAMHGCDIVFHNAAIADIDTAMTVPVDVMRTNVVGTAKVLKEAHDQKVGRVVFASSIYVAGNRGGFYRISKVAGEELCKEFKKNYGLNYTITRYGSLYGAGANHWNFIYRLCKDLLTKGEFYYPSSKDAMREFIHVTDAARLTVDVAMDTTYENQTVMITGHQRIRMQELFDMVSEMIPRDVKIHYTEKEGKHYVYTPYTLDVDAPIRVPLGVHTDIADGLLESLKIVRSELE